MGFVKCTKGGSLELSNMIVVIMISIGVSKRGLTWLLIIWNFVGCFSRTYLWRGLLIVLRVVSFRPSNIIVEMMISTEVLGMCLKWLLLLSNFVECFIRRQLRLRSLNVLWVVFCVYYSKAEEMRIV